IVTHENADFDAAAALLAAARLHPGAVPLLPERSTQNVQRFVALYQNGLPFQSWRDVKPGDVTRMIVVDTQRVPQIKGLRAKLPTLIIDHHPLTRELQAHQQFSGETTGAMTTLLVEQIREQHLALTPLEATLLALGIYEDTGSLSHGSTTTRDLLAAAWLLEQKAALDTVRRFLSPPMNEEQQQLYERLMIQAEQRTIEGHSIIVSAARVDHYVAEISTVAHRLRDLMDAVGLFIVVEMPSSTQLVARSTDDAVDAGAIARRFGGGGHTRAAAATIHNQTLEASVALIWEGLYEIIRPVTRVADLMSYGVQTVSAEQPLARVVQRLRRIGHEGYPVVQGGALVGLLTRRDVDRALEHGLGHLPVREVMLASVTAVHPSDSVFTLEQRIVESGWGQVPVLDESEQLIGIVTRTDLIKHWARIHPVGVAAEPRLNAEQIETVLGGAVTRLIRAIVEEAQQHNLKLYLVGGVVRDLLLKRPNYDIDFVVEGSAITLAEYLEARYGGSTSAFVPFGTAKWKPDGASASALGVGAALLPDHIDFASARNEFYEHPTALPTVYNSSIKLDLGRRDFTINTLAVQLSPAAAYGRILDYYGGLHDLDSKLIRALHSLSFVDDPTRILRAVRFEQRLGFQIEARTAELINTAEPMLGRITGERLRNEFGLLLNEEEPEYGLMNLERRGVLRAIHAAFELDRQIVTLFRAARAELPWTPEHITREDLYWHLIAGQIAPAQLADWCERLLFSKSLTLSFANLAKRHDLSAPEMRPSAVVDTLAGCGEAALLASWLLSDDDAVKTRIRRYWLEWRHIHPVTNGHTLRARGLTPGPCYALILARLRQARLDGDVTSDVDEAGLLESMIAEGICDDRT
ncbi:MAG: CBS domain-containing protein, partial [Anaerolineae bacterium]|nr:CBS domain-containing protein [Anaerolineae bacterium]